MEWLLEARDELEEVFGQVASLLNLEVNLLFFGAWLHARAVQAAGRLVIAIDGKTVRGAKDKTGPRIW